jgi:hypothetical protein
VYVEGYKDAFQATIYDNAVMEYFWFVFCLSSWLHWLVIQNLKYALL